jgi:hypothetical protein
MMCHKCGLVNHLGAGFCRQCGTQLPPTPRSAYPDEPRWWSLQSRAAKTTFLVGLVLAAGIVGAVAVSAASGLPAPRATVATTRTVDPVTTPAMATDATDATTSPVSGTGLAAPDTVVAESTITPTRTLAAQSTGQNASEGSGTGYLRAFLVAKRTQIADPEELENWWRSTVWYRRYPQYRKPLAEVLTELGVSAQPAAGQTWTQIHPPAAQTEPQADGPAAPSEGALPTTTTSLP